MYPCGLPVELFIADYMFTKEKGRKSGMKEEKALRRRAKEFLMHD